MLVPLHRTSRNLYPSTAGIVQGFVCHDNIATFREGRDHARYGREGLRVDDTRGCAKMCGDGSLETHVNVLGTVKARWSAWTDAMGAQGADGAILEIFIAEEVVEVIACKVKGCAGYFTDVIFLIVTG